MQQMPVIAGGSVVGIVTRDSILRVLQTRHELGTLREAIRTICSVGFSLRGFDFAGQRLRRGFLQIAGILRNFFFTNAPASESPPLGVPNEEGFLASFGMTGDFWRLSRG